MSAVNEIGTSLPSEIASIFLDLDLPTYVSGNLSFGSNETEWNQFYVNPPIEEAKLSAIGIK